MLRHAKRDEEAGGPGLGVLDTRKRTRRLPDGSIVTRPSKRQSRSLRTNNNDEAPAVIVRQLPSASSQSSPSSSSRSECSNRYNSVLTPEGAPASPPYTLDRASRFGSNISLSNETLDESVNGVGGSNPAGGGDGGGADGDESLLAPMMPGGPYEPFVEPIPGQFDVADGAWQTDTMLPVSSLDADYYDAFNLDTGMPLSFSPSLQSKDLR